MKYFERTFDELGNSIFKKDVNPPDLMNNKVLVCFPTDKAIAKKLKLDDVEENIYIRNMMGNVRDFCRNH